MNKDGGQDWIKWDGGGCPIPWAKKGEFELSPQGVMSISCDACQWLWSTDNTLIKAYRLTDGWIPVLNGVCPVKEGEMIDYRMKDGNKVYKVTCNPGDGMYANGDIVAIRKVVQVKEKLQDNPYLLTPEQKKEYEERTRPTLANPHKQLRDAIDGWEALVEGKKEGPLVAWKGEWTCLKR